jgi:regulator of protease activity HflC (stomatin/prohibitin superfamily)
MADPNTPDKNADGHPADVDLYIGSDRPAEEMKVEERSGASLTLTEESDLRVERSASMAMANRSLADALQATYRVLQIVMVLLVGLFVLNGFQSVGESQSGVKTRFGAIVQTDLEPGFHFAWPRPFGSIKKVDVSTVRVPIREQFFPRVAVENPTQDFSGLRGQNRLNPVQDGSLITADQSLAHASFDVNYDRSDPSAFLENVHPEHEEQIVKSAIHSAVVQVTARTSIDDLLRRNANSEDDAPSAGARTSLIEERIRRIAQDNLDRIGGIDSDGLPIGAGIQITAVRMTNAHPPIPVVRRFNEVNNAVSRAESESQNARRERTTILSRTAGPAADTLLQLIDNYEAYTDLGRNQDAERTLDTLFAVIDGNYRSETLFIEDPLTGESITRPESGEPRNFGNVTVQGQVATQIREAQTYRVETVNRARSERNRFEIALEQYRVNPAFFVADRWGTAMAQLAENSFVERFMLPAGAQQVQLLLNDDPEIARRAERARNQRDAEAARQRAEDRFR